MIGNIYRESYGYSAKTTIALFGKNQEVTLFFDEETDCTPNNQAFFDNLSKFLNDSVNFDKLLIEIANEVADICFCQSDEKPNKQEILECANNLSIIKINVFLDDMVVYLITPKFLPNLVVTCQMDCANHTKNIELVDERYISMTTMLDNIS